MHGNPPSAPDKPVRDQLLVFGAPRIDEVDIAELTAVLRSGWLGFGARTTELEDRFRRYVGCGYAVATSSCSAALHLSLLSLGVGHGDEVITTPLTYCATAHVVEHVGARPVFVDVEPHSRLIDPQQVQDAITTRTRAILPVHLAGLPCDMEKMLELGRRHGLPLLEDAAHALGALCAGGKIGTLGTATCFSFSVGKSLCTGEGGMLVTDDQDLATKARLLSREGVTTTSWERFAVAAPGRYEVVAPGYKYAMTDLHASLALRQFDALDSRRARRDEIWRRYEEEFADLPLRLPPTPRFGVVHARQLFSVLLDVDDLSMSRDEVAMALRAENIGTGVHFVSLHLHPFYRDKYELTPGQFPNATHISERTLSLPLSSHMTDQDVGDVIQAMRKVLGQGRGSR
ncbi:DegT/DnrJ/EryC1/StrS family aminotransferase [Planctomycetota bacterium]